MYGSAPGQPKRETSPVVPESPYAATKAANEVYAATWSATMGLPCVGLRYFNVFGPRQDPAGPYAAVLPRFVESALAGSVLPIHGDGEQGRDFVHVRDVARANLAACEAGPEASGQVFNIGTGRMTTVNQLAERVLHATGSSARVEHLAPRPGDVRFSRADVSRAREVLGWEATEDLDAGLLETAAWFRDG